MLHVGNLCRKSWENRELPIENYGFTQEEAKVYLKQYRI